MATDTAEITEATEEPETDTGFALQRQYDVPGDDKFKGGDFIEANDIGDIAEELIGRFRDDFPRFERLRMDYLWRKKGGMLNGEETLGACNRTAPLVAYYADTEFTVWIAADHARELQLTGEDMRALVFHLLLHIEYREEKDKHAIRGPEFTGFIRELEVFGPWRRSLRRAQKAFSQPGLPLHRATAGEGDVEGEGMVRQSYAQRKGTERRVPAEAGSRRVAPAAPASSAIARVPRDPCPRCGNRVCSCLEDAMLGILRHAGLPTPTREHRFAPGRMWRFDLAYPSLKVGIECEGGTWSGGRHTRPEGYENDCDKYDNAAVLGWLVLRFTKGMIADERALVFVERALRVRGMPTEQPEPEQATLGFPAH